MESRPPGSSSRRELQPSCLLLIRRKMARLSKYEERINVLYLITKLLMLIDCRFRIHYQITRRSVQVDLTFQHAKTLAQGPSDSQQHRTSVFNSTVPSAYTLANWNAATVHQRGSLLNGKAVTRNADINRCGGQLSTKVIKLIYANH